MAATSNAKAGDLVELKDKEGGFTDPDTGFDISRDQRVELGETVGQRTHEALMSGGLLLVKSGKSSSKNLGEGGSNDETELPTDLPGREAFVEAGLTFPQIKELNEEQLVAIKGIGPKTVEALKAWAADHK